MTGKLTAIGYRGLTHEKFFGLLDEAQVRILLDVRRNPYSPNPLYQQGLLHRASKKNRVKYFHVPQLGVPGAGKSEIPPGAPTTFSEQLKTQAAARSLDKIVSLLAKGHNVALMCAEPNYRDCHRVVLVEMLQQLAPAIVFEELTARGEVRLF